MKKTLYYTFIFDSNYYDDYRDFPYSVDESLQDVIEYVYEKTYNKKYSPLSWYLTEGAKELVKSLETKWMHNELDMSEFYQDPHFYDWLKDKYYNVALDKCCTSQQEIVYNIEEE